MNIPRAVQSGGDGKVWYIDDFTARQLVRDGCPHCGSKDLVMRMHPQRGGKFYGCVNDCRNAQGLQFYLAKVSKKDRHIDLKDTHAYKAGGFPHT